MNWYRIDERREISADFITCAEYQLFLDEKRTQGEYHQPDHWDVHQFPKGQSQKPILGVRGKDASQFCEWLSRRKGNKFRYRLPTLEEVSSHPGMASGDISCWCAAGEKWFIHEFNPTQWKEWWRLFLSAFTNDWSCVSRALAEASDHNPDRRTFTLTDTLNRDLGIALIHALAFVRDLDLDLDRARTLALELPLDLADLDLDLILNRTGARDSDRALDLALDLARARIRDSDRTFVIARDNLSTLRIVCCISIFFSMIKDNSSNTKLAWFKRLWPKQIKTDFDSYIEEQRRDAALNLYAFFFLIEERRKGNLPAWEGIRIVRERIE